MGEQEETANKNVRHQDRNALTQKQLQPGNAWARRDGTAGTHHRGVLNSSCPATASLSEEDAPVPSQQQPNSQPPHSSCTPAERQAAVAGADGCWRPAKASACVPRSPPKRLHRRGNMPHAHQEELPQVLSSPLGQGNGQPHVLCNLG